MKKMFMAVLVAALSGLAFAFDLSMITRYSNQDFSDGKNESYSDSIYLLDTGINASELYIKDGGKASLVLKAYLKRTGDNSVRLDITSADRKLLYFYDIFFDNGCTVKVNQDTYVLDAKSYDVLKADLNERLSLNSAISFLDYGLYRHTDSSLEALFYNFGHKRESYLVKSAVFRMQSPFSDMMYDYKASYKYKGLMLKEMSVVNTAFGNDVYTKALIKEDPDLLTYSVFYNSFDMAVFNYKSFVDRNTDNTVDSGNYIHISSDTEADYQVWQSIPIVRKVTSRDEALKIMEKSNEK